MDLPLYSLQKESFLESIGDHLKITQNQNGSQPSGVEYQVLGIKVNIDSPCDCTLQLSNQKLKTKNFQTKNYKLPNVLR